MYFNFKKYLTKISINTHFLGIDTGKFVVPLWMWMYALSAHLLLSVFIIDQVVMKETPVT